MLHLYQESLKNCVNFKISQTVLCIVAKVLFESPTLSPFFPIFLPIPVVVAIEGGEVIEPLRGSWEEKVVRKHGVEFVIWEASEEAIEELDIVEVVLPLNVAVWMPEEGAD